MTVNFQQVMERAAEWLEDPEGVRRKFTQRANNQALPVLIQAMREATMDRASSMAFLRGEKELYQGPIINCSQCAKIMTELLSVELCGNVQSYQHTIWYGDKYGWVCECCETPVEGVAPPVIALYEKELPN